VTDRNGVRGQRSIGLTVDATAPIWASLPPIQFTQGTAGSINLNSFCTDPQGLTLNFSLISGSLPAGVSFLSPLLSYNGSGAVGSDAGVAFSASNGAASSNSSQTTVAIIQAQQPGALPALTLTPSQTNATGPWTFGQAFKQGDVPPGNYVTATVSGSSFPFQAAVRNLWPDGSVKYAVLSGISNFTNSNPLTVQLAATSTAPSGANITEPTSLPNTNATFTAGTGSFPVSGICDINSALGVDLSTWNRSSAGRVRQILGPVMSEFHYYVPLAPASNQVAVWFFVRKWVTGAIEIETVVENGFWQLASPGPSEADYSVTVNINNVAVFTQSNIKHYTHTRWSRVDWYSGGAAVTPAHNVPYLLSTRMVPNFGWGPSSGSPTFSTTLGSWRQTTTNPATVFSQSGFYGDLPTDGTISGGGQSPWIGPLTQWEAEYCTSADPRVYAATVGNTRQWGGFGQHFRDESTGRVPLWSSYPTKGVYSSGNPLPPTPAGGVPPVYGDTLQADPTHVPACGFLAYLIEGRWSHIEELQFTAWLNVQDQNLNQTGWDGHLIANGFSTTRGLAWALRGLAHSGMAPTALNPGVPAADAALRNSLVASLSASISSFKQIYIDGTATLPGGFSGANAIGWIGQYDHYTAVSGSFWGADWMVTFQGMALSIAADLCIEGIANQADVISVRNFSYLDTLSLIQAGATGQGNPQTTGNAQNPTWNYRRGITYSRPYLTNADSSGAVPANPNFYGGGSIAGLSSAFTAYLGTGNPENPSGLSPSLSSAPSQSIKAHDSESDIGVGSSTGTGGDTSSLGGENYGAMHLTIAALAVEAALPGAIDKFALLTGSTTYQGTSGSGSTTTPVLAGAADAPQMSFLPRTQATDNTPAILTAPSWLPAVGTWGPIPNSIINGSAAQLFGAYTGGSGGWLANTNDVMANWCSGAVVTVGIYDNAGNWHPGTWLVYMGGGHAGYAGNELYAIGPLESNSPTIVCPRAATNPPPTNENMDGSGNYAANHTYDSIVYLPNQNQVVRCGMFFTYVVGTSFNDVPVFQCNYPTPVSGQPWTSLTSMGSVTGGNPAGSAVYDPINNGIWARAGAGPGESYDLMYLDLATKVWSISRGIFTYNDLYFVGALDTKRGILAFWNGSAQSAPTYEIIFYQTNNGVANTPFIPSIANPGSAPSQGASFGSMLYDEANDRFVIWNNSGKTLYTLTAPASGNPYTGSWTWGTIVPSAGSTPTSENATGTFKRFSYVRNALIHGFVLANRTTDSVYFYRLS